MSTLTLIRHGQATPFQRESDRLSPLGEQQARAMADYWIGNGDSFDEVYTGTLERQRRTEAIAAQEFRDLRQPWPEAQATVAWNEYDAQGVLTRFVPALAERDGRFAELVRNFEASRGTPEQNKHFQLIFEIAMAQWLEGVAEIDGVEPFHAFRARVLSALQAILGQPGSRRIAVFTSGGPIGLLVQHVLKAPDRTFLDINWRIRNGSITEFVFGGGRISLDLFNQVAHLPPRFHSFR